MADPVDFQKITDLMESMVARDANFASRGLTAETKDAINQAHRAGTLSAHDFFHNEHLVKDGEATPFAQLCAGRYDQDNAAGCSLEQHRSLHREVLSSLIAAAPADLAGRRQDQQGDTALQCYLDIDYHTLTDCVEARSVAELLERGGLDVDAEYGVRGTTTSLYKAVSMGRPELVRMLLSAGAPAARDNRAMERAVFSDKAEILGLLLSAGAGDSSGGLRNAFLGAARADSLACMSLLADADAFDSEMRWYALREAIRNQAWSCVEGLLARPDMLADSATLQGSFGVLVDGINWDDQDAPRQAIDVATSLIAAGLPRPSLSGYDKWLYEHYGFKTNQRAAQRVGWWRKHQPSSRQRRALLSHLLKELEVPAGTGLLHSAIKFEAPAADLQLICEQAPEQVNQPDESGIPPLQALLLQTRAPDAKVTGAQVKALLEYGADPNVHSAKHPDALTLARDYCPEQVALLLEDYGAVANQVAGADGVRFA